MINYVVTGTRAYGPDREDSDLDIVIRSDIAADFHYDLLQAGIKVWKTEEQERETYGGFYFDVCGITINVIEAKVQAEFGAWKVATEQMKERPIINDREKRINLFVQLRERALLKILDER